MTSNLLGFEKILEVKWDLDDEDGNGFVLSKESPESTLFDDFYANQKRLEHSDKLREYLVDFLKEPRDNSELYRFVMKKGYLCKHATGILKQLQDDGRLDVIEISTGNAARKGSFYLNYKETVMPKVRFFLK